MKVLVIEDDRPTAEFIRRRLNDAGHSVSLAFNGNDGLQLIVGGSYDVLVVDRMLPGKSGLDVINELRRQGTNIPVLVVTALGSLEDRIFGLRSGADDYLTKPFAFAELLARLEALARRPALRTPSDNITIADLEIEVRARSVVRAGKRIDLTPQEFKLLLFLAERAGETITRKVLLEEVWGLRFDPRTNIVEAHMSRLRAKIDRGFETDLIQTKHGVGYVLAPP